VEIQSVLSVAPLRISFMGGGTDIPSFYEKSNGCVVSTAINKYVYVHIKRHDPLFQERYRISYSEVEHTNSRHTIKNQIVRSCLELLDIDEPIQISTSADLPANSGLGSSSSFAVALLNGLHALRKENASRVQLAEEASEVEIRILESPIGKQDQYAASFGGINYFEFHNDGSVVVEPLNLSISRVTNLFNNSLLIWTGQARSANSILADQAQRADDNFGGLLELTKLTKVFKASLLDERKTWIELGPLVNSGWTHKKSFSEKILTSEVESITQKLNKLGSCGHKLLGAGGGGFIFATFEKIKPNITSEMRMWRTFVPSIDFQGARIESVC
jgi:D-glycero-alpha-D-manno-heptose-7-phosphate kinase